MKGVIYSESDGTIESVIQFAPPHVANQNLGDSEAILVDGAIPDSVPDGMPVYSGFIPNDTTGKIVDSSTSPPSFVDDPNYSEADSREQILTDFDNGDIDVSQALRRVLQL